MPYLYLFLSLKVSSTNKLLGLPWVPRSPWLFPTFLWKILNLKPSLQLLSTLRFGRYLWMIPSSTCLTFINMPHGIEKLDVFLQHLNNQSSSIKFTMETEINGRLPFLDVLISEKYNGSFSHQVFQKKTHT